MAKLTDAQQDLMDYVNDEFFTGEDYYYCETGSCKPWNKKTVNALVDKGLVTAEAFCEGTVFYLRKVATSEEHFKAVNAICVKMGLRTFPSYDNSDAKLKSLYDEHLKKLEFYNANLREEREQAIKERKDKRTALIARLTDEELSLLGIKRG